MNDPSMSKTSLWLKLQEEITHCKKCPRLVYHRENVPAKKIFKDEVYWRKPVPGFGDPDAWLFIAGLAPAGDGGNRTGRVFTGDATGRFLIRALYELGLANQPHSESREDGLRLMGCYMTAVVKCYPPQHKPTAEECLNCRPYFEKEMELLKELKSVLVLGHLAFNVFLSALKKRNIPTEGLCFKHGASYKLKNGWNLYCSYHPTPRNVNTGTLTKEMFSQLLNHIQADHRHRPDLS